MLLGRDAGQATGQGQGIEGVDRAELAHHRAGLVGLKAADEMPVEGFKIGKLRLLGRCLLEPALAETALARSHRLPDPGDRLALTHRQQPAPGGQAGAHQGELLR